MLFEACLQGHLSHVPRRPHDRERNQLIRSGCVFIYEENASGIKRWTDGVTWSPSRILGNFLVYRELDKPFPPGEKKRANKEKKRRPSRPGDPYARPEGSANDGGYSPTTPQSSSFGAEKPATEMERQLIGSLIDSYGFKADGLVKKTMSVTVQGVTHHLVSYYNVTDVLNNQLRTPSQTENLHYIRPRPELTSSQSFRSPLEEVDDYENQVRQAQGQGYAHRIPAPGYMPEYRHPTQGYYMSHPYPSMPQQQPPANYSVANAPMPPTYLQNPVPVPQMPPQRSQAYGSYENNQYNRSYESLNSSTAPGSAIKPEHPAPAANMGDRPQQQPPMYPQTQAPARQMSNLSPVPVDSRPQPYYAPASNQGQVDVRAPVPSPQSLPGFDHTRGQHQASPDMYNGQRPAYYPEGPGPAMQHSGPYGQAPQMTPWQGGAAPAQAPQ